MNKLWWNFEVNKYSPISVIFFHQNLASHFNFHQILWINFTKISDIFLWVIFTNFGEYIFENLSKSFKLSQILVTKFLKISLIQQNFHQFWWKNMCKIINKYCHRFRWNFHHLITHYFLWFTKKSPELVKIQPKNRQKIKLGSYLG